MPVSRISLLLVVESKLDFAGRSVGDSAVERIFENAPLVEFRTAVALQAAADNPLVKTVQKAQTTRIGQRNELRMDRSVDGRLPADFDRAGLPPLAEPTFPNPHSPSRQHHEAEAPVIDFDAIDSLLQAAPQSRLPDVEIVAGNAQFGRGEQKLRVLAAGAGVDECPIFLSHGSLRLFQKWFA